VSTPVHDYIRHLLWPVLKCPECEGRKELDYPRWPQIVPLPSPPLIEVRRELCHTCKGKGVVS